MRRVATTTVVLIGALQVAAGAVEMQPAEVKAARKLNVVKCARCHKLYSPTAYAETDWLKWMEKMRGKSKLKPEQSDLLTRYFEALRAGAPAGGK